MALRNPVRVRARLRQYDLGNEPGELEPNLNTNHAAPRADVAYPLQGGILYRDAARRALPPADTPLACPVSI